ncbi:MAG: hypothetical protein WCH21_11470 [Bacteroidota bacterium]
MSNPEKTLIENNYFGKLIGMDFIVISEGIIDYSITSQNNHLSTPKSA